MTPLLKIMQEIWNDGGVVHPRCGIAWGINNSYGKVRKGWSYNGRLNLNCWRMDDDKFMFAQKGKTIPMKRKRR